MQHVVLRAGHTTKHGTATQPDRTPAVVHASCLFKAELCRSWRNSSQAQWGRTLTRTIKGTLHKGYLE
eukprot:517430-Pelagomonas_calceolata.AAC.2